MANQKVKKSPLPLKNSSRGDAILQWLRRYYLMPALLLAFACSLINLVEFNDNKKWLIVCLCFLSALLCIFGARKGKLKERLSLPVLAMAAYLCFVALSVCWAVAGKFYLREFSKLLYVLPLYLFILLCLPREVSAVRRLLTVLSATSAFYALFSVDMATLELTAPLLNRIPGIAGLSIGFESGTRLFGIFGNANISASLLAISIFFSLWLLETAERKAERISAAVFLSMQAYNFLLNFSMGATGFFLVCVIVYLICSGSRRVGSLLRMLFAAIPTLIFVFISFSAFEAEHSPLPLLCMLGNILVTVGLELFVRSPVEQLLLRRNMLTKVFFGAVVLCIVLYASAGLLLSDDLTLTAGINVKRSCYPAVGNYTMQLDAEGSVNLRIVSQDEKQIVMHTDSVLYEGAAENVAFSVPEGSKVVYITFSSSESAVVRQALLLDAGGTSSALHLDYPLFPDFIANRLQGLFANENAVQRTAFFRDGMKIFREHPIVGAGLGGFESQIYGHQDFRYETRYVHNHYVQVLLDSGIIGLLFYAAVLLFSLLCLFRGRKQEHPFHTLFPALLSSLLMLILHTTMEVSMSVLVYLPYAFAVFGLIALCFGKPMKVKWSSAVCRYSFLLLSFCYGILIWQNIGAAKLVNNSTGSYKRFFESLSQAIRRDVFEYTDWKVSYLNNCANLQIEEYKAAADKYAYELLDVPSNALHQYLLDYYLSFRDYELALTAASNGAAFNYADSNTWNGYFASFLQALRESPEDEAAIYADVLALNEQMEGVQSRLLDKTVLNEAALYLIQEAQQYAGNVG